MTRKELIGCISGIVGLIAMCFAVYFFFESRYAHAGDMVKAMKAIRKMEIRLDYKIVEDQLRGIQKDIYIIEDRYCTDKSKPCTEEKMPQTVRERYRELVIEKENLRNELKDLKDKNKVVVYKDVIMPPAPAAPINPAQNPANPAPPVPGKQGK